MTFSRKKRGFTLIELMIVVAIIGILSLIAIPNFFAMRARAYHSSAISAGRNAKTAMEVYYTDQPGTFTASYTEYLSDLLSYDKNLTEDTQVTFIFTHSNNSGYTYYTQHGQAPDKTFQFHS